MIRCVLVLPMMMAAPETDHGMVISAKTYGSAEVPEPVHTPDVLCEARSVSLLIWMVGPDVRMGPLVRSGPMGPLACTATIAPGEAKIDVININDMITRSACSLPCSCYPLFLSQT